MRINYAFILLTLFAFGCSKTSETPFQCNNLEFTLPKGWSLDYINNDFTTFMMVDSAWSFSPKSWGRLPASGKTAGAQLIIMVGDFLENTTLKSFVDYVTDPEGELLIQFFHTYSEIFMETLESIDAYPSEEHLSSGTWYLLSKKETNDPKDDTSNYIIELRIKIYNNKVFLIYIKDFEDHFERNREKYYNKILNSIRFIP
ncbi:MAG: hypothetical protein ACK4KT_05725 [Thermaurantimonas sp.]